MSTRDHRDSPAAAAAHTTDDDPARLRREPPARTAPIRNAMTLLRAAPADSAARGPVERVVETAYRVVDDAMRAGQEFARSYSRTIFPTPPEPSREPMQPNQQNQADPQDMARRATRFWGDMIALWFDSMSAFLPPGMPNPLRPGEWDPRNPDAPAGGPAARARHDELAVDLEVSSHKPVQVSLALPPGSAGRTLRVLDLRQLDDEKAPAITGVTLTHAEPGRATLKLHVPAELPPGKYVGGVFDTARGEIRGTVTVTVSK